MSLVRFSQIDEPYQALSDKIRHIYDLDQMLKNESVISFFKSGNFSKMLQKVGKDGFISYKNNNEWLKDHPCSAIVFKNPEMVWKHLQNNYKTIFKDLVIGDLPDENDLIASLQKIENRIKVFDWKI